MVARDPAERSRLSREAAITRHSRRREQQETIDRLIQRIVDEAPPLSDDQLAALRLILRAGVQS